jgi:hypothetical protein
MNAHAMVGRFTVNFNSATMANEINKHDFTNLITEILRGKITLDAGYALYLYGGRKSLLTAIAQLGAFRIVGYNEEQIALFRVSRPVAGGLKTKQLLVIAPVPDGIPKALRPYLVSLRQQETDTSLQHDTILTMLSNLPKK